MSKHQHVRMKRGGFVLAILRGKKRNIQVVDVYDTKAGGGKTKKDKKK